MINNVVCYFLVTSCSCFVGFSTLFIFYNLYFSANLIKASVVTDTAFYNQLVPLLQIMHLMHIKSMN